MPLYGGAMVTQARTTKDDGLLDFAFGAKGALTAFKQDPYTEVHVQAESTYHKRVGLRIHGGEKRK